MRVGVDVHVHGDFLLSATMATSCSALDASVVERRVVRAEIAGAAIPQRRHCDCGLDGLLNWYQRQD